MKSSRHFWELIFISCILSGCLEPYSPPISSDELNLLVVDGFLNTSDGNVLVRLTKASNLGEDANPQPVLRAAIFVEDDQGTSHQLVEQDTGSYALDNITINSTAKYRLRIRTTGAAEYVSDFISIRETPPIDSITYHAEDESLVVKVNTHDNSGNTRYYHWEFIETWQYHAQILSSYKLVDRLPAHKSPEELTYYCWRTVPSTRILINSTSRLSEDIVSQFPITKIPAGSSKLSMTYSTLVIQRAISKEEFNFLEQLKKTTESIGSLFDPQPGQVSGNIHALNAASPAALGYFSAGNVTTQRFFINFFDLPKELQKIVYPFDCAVDTLCVIPFAYVCVMDLDDLTGTETIGQALYIGNFAAGYTLSNTTCADCRKQGGVLTKPDYWP